MPETFTLSHVVPTTPQRIFEAWMSSSEHSKMTGAAANISEDAFTAWDGYISGKTLSSQPYERIVQRWRTNEFPEGATDSDLVISFAPTDGGTQVTVQASNLPDGQGPGYEAGWKDFYFTPMTEYFGTPGAKFKEAADALENAVEAAVDQASAQMTKVVNSAKKGSAKAVKSAKKAASSFSNKVRAALKPKAKAKAKPAKKAAASAKKTALSAKKAVKKVVAKASKALKGKPAKKVAAKASKAVKKAAPAKKKSASKKKSRR